MTTPDTANPVRCEGCCGMGYKGRYRKQGGKRVWKIETHWPCRGTGSRERQRNTRYTS